MDVSKREHGAMSWYDLRLSETCKVLGPCMPKDAHKGWEGLGFASVAAVKRYRMVTS